MSLNEEYKRKIDCYIDNIEKRIFKPISCLELEGFATKERLTLDEAKGNEKSKYKSGEKWGKRWEYLWLFATCKIAPENAGNRIVLRSEIAESTVFVNDSVYGAFDLEHRYITLLPNAKGGEEFSVAIESYAGDDERNLSYVNLPCSTHLSDEELRQEIKDITIGTFSNEVFYLWMDIKTLYDLRNNLDENLLRTAMIDKGLKDVCDFLDIELPEEEFLQAVIKAREILKPLFECKNGSTAPTMYAIGHSHLDLEWLWTKNETRRKSARTLGNQLKIIEEYDNYIYLQSQPWILETVKNEYPELYERVKKAVSDGKIIVEGGMYVESDTNIPSGENLVRQFIFGKKFIKDEFGKESEILWLPDIFGCSASIPQIMKKCGVNYFINAKVPWMYNGGVEFPYNNFMWEGIDGTKVLTHMFQEYATELTPSKVFEKWNSCIDKENVPARIYPFGHGDGGGGATRIHLEYAHREENLEGLPKVEMKTPNEFFKDVEGKYTVTDRYVGEMYYPAHRGSYTSQAKTKKLCRQSEFALRDAELWSSVADSTNKSETDALWKEVLFNDFHDIIPGTSIGAVYERAEKSYENVIEKCAGIISESVEKLVSADDNAITVFNSLGFERTAVIELPDGFAAIADENGNKVPVQNIDGKIYAEVTLPSVGYKTFYKADGECSLATQKETVVLENELIRCVFNEKAELISVFDKEKGIEFLQEASNKFRMYRDMPTFFDAWDIDSFYEKCEVSVGNNVKITAVYEGELISYIDTERTIGKSVIKQRISLKKDSRRVDFATNINWKETHKLLKVDFTSNIHTDEMISEIQYGYIKRPNHKTRLSDKERFEVCQHKWSVLKEEKRGFGIINDSKYGISADDGRMSLTLLKSPSAPDLNADKGVHDFTYSIYVFGDSLFDSGIQKEALCLNVKPVYCIGKAETKSIFKTNCDNVIIDTVKTAEDGSGDIIVRMYEAYNSYTNCELTVNMDFKKAVVTDMLENNICDAQTRNNTVNLKFGGFEVVTLRLVR